MLSVTKWCPPPACWVADVKCRAVLVTLNEPQLYRQQSTTCDTIETETNRGTEQREGTKTLEIKSQLRRISVV